MLKPLTNILFKIFSDTFYKAHAGIFFLLLLVIIGPGSPGKIIAFHKSLMLLFIVKPLGMMIVFAVLLLYTFKCWHFISGKIQGADQQFLFYSINSYSKPQQLIGWMILQTVISLPILLYLLISVGVAISYHYFSAALIIIIYTLGLLMISSYFYYWLIDKLIDGYKLPFILKLTRGLKKPFFTLYVYHVFDELKLKYLIIKFLSYFSITLVFLLFEDVKSDIRVAGIAMLAVAVAHSMLILNERQFENSLLMFTRGLPISRPKLFTSLLFAYSILLLPEAVWLLFSLPVTFAVGLFVFCLSIILFFVSSLYFLGTDHDKYIKIIFLVFLITFIMILFKLLWLSVLINFFVAYMIFYRNYYKFKEEPIRMDE
jgi:hypothetical protein